MTTRSDCNIIRWLWPALAAWLEPACDAHDYDYRHRRWWLLSDLRWAWRVLRRAWDAVRERRWLMAAGSVLAAVIGFPLLVLGGWVLYFDVDKLVKRRLGL